jgi:hypothetical protein
MRKILFENIDKDTKFFSENIYVIIGEIRVLEGVTLIIEDNTKIYITNGTATTPEGNKTGKSCLIFETGSTLYAERVYFQACNKCLCPIYQADNGGIIFLGSSSIAEKDLVPVTFSTKKSNFNATLIHASYLGAKDIVSVEKDLDIDDFDAISVIGVNNNEWNIKDIYSEFSGDDGFDIENSDITVQNITVKIPNEDGINITSSRVNVIESFNINMTINKTSDRDILDLETDDGPAFIRIAQDCLVNIDGILGDKLTLVSNDLPQPIITPGGKELPYKFKGYTVNGQSYIYSGFFGAT